MTYRVEYLRSVVEDDIPALPKSAKRQVRRAIEATLTTHPFELGKPLRYSLRGARRLRVGDYRVIYRIERSDVVLVVKIGLLQVLALSACDPTADILPPPQDSPTGQQAQQQAIAYFNSRPITHREATGTDSSSDLTITLQIALDPEASLLFTFLMVTD